MATKSTNKPDQTPSEGADQTVVQAASLEEGTKEAQGVYADFLKTGTVKSGWEVSRMYPGGARKTKG